MKEFSALVIADVKVLRFWLLRNTISKLIVMVGFLTLFVLLDLGIYQGTTRFLSLFQNTYVFGVITAFYMIHSAIIVLCWFAIFSTCFTTLTLFLKNDSTTSFLVSQPIKPIVIVAWIGSKALLIQSLLIGTFLFPVVLGSSTVFSIGFSFLSFLTLLLVTLILAVATVAIGTFLGFSFLSKTQGSFRKSLLLLGLFFFSSGIVIFRSVYPSDISLFETSRTTADFIRIFHQLPIGNTYLPTYWLASSFLNGVRLNVILLLAWVLFLTCVVFFDVSEKFLLFYQRIHEERLWKTRTKNIQRKSFSSIVSIMQQTRFPILVKDWVSIRRFPSEVGYAIFLGCLASVFFLLLLVLSWNAKNFGQLHQEVVLFFFGSIAFFATAFLLRFSFPLMAREGASAWYLFTQPISNHRILVEKLLLSFLLLLPFDGLIIIIWLAASFVDAPRILLIGMSLLTVSLISITTTLLGAIAPNFQEAKDPEKISTSGIGLFSLAVSICLVALNAMLLSYMLNEIYLIPFLSIITIILNAVILFCVYTIYHNTNHYQF